MPIDELNSRHNLQWKKKINNEEKSVPNQNTVIDHWIHEFCFLNPLAWLIGKKVKADIACEGAVVLHACTSWWFRQNKSCHIFFGHFLWFWTTMNIKYSPWVLILGIDLNAFRNDIALALSKKSVDDLDAAIAIYDNTLPLVLDKHPKQKKVA